MAALDFPANPTVGQQYAAPNGVTYQWDGAAWVVTGGPPATPTGPAGGDLSGTYPNPAVAAGAIITAKLANAPNGITVGKINAGQGLWTSGNAFGPASGIVLTGTSQYLTGLSIGLAASRILLILATVHVTVSRTAAGGGVGTCTVTLQIGGGATTPDGTVLTTLVLDSNIANGSTIPLHVPVIYLYTPAATGAQFVKVFAATSDATNYYMSANANATVINVVEFP